MAGTGTPDAGAPHPRSPVWPPRRAETPGPAAAPDERARSGPRVASGDPWPGRAGEAAGLHRARRTSRRGRLGSGSARDPAERSRRVERLLWLLVAVIGLTGVVVIGAIVRSGPQPGDVQPLAEVTSPHSVPSPPDDGAGGRVVDPRDDTEDDRAPPSGDDPDSADRGGGGPAAPTEVAPDEVAPRDVAPAGWSEAARGFGLAFTRTSAGQEAWFAAMSSWLTPEQAALYREVAIEDIPAGELIEVDVAEPGSTPHTRGTLTYDTGMVLEVGLSHVESAGGWLVARVSLVTTEPLRRRPGSTTSTLPGHQPPMPQTSAPSPARSPTPPRQNSGSATPCGSPGPTDGPGRASALPSA